MHESYAIRHILGSVIGMTKMNNFDLSYNSYIVKMIKMNKMNHFDPPYNSYIVKMIKMNKMNHFDPPYNFTKVKMKSFSFILIMSSKDAQIRKKIFFKESANSNKCK